MAGRVLLRTSVAMELARGSASFSVEDAVTFLREIFWVVVFVIDVFSLLGPECDALNAINLAEILDCGGMESLKDPNSKLTPQKNWTPFVLILDVLCVQ